jgi:hypothetical protein
MKWLRFAKYIEAAREDNSFASFLERIGASPEAIQFISSLTDPLSRQKAIGFLQKNPKANPSMISSFINSKPINNVPQKNEPANTSEEITFSNNFAQNEEFMVWCLQQMRKMRLMAVHSGRSLANEILYQNDQSDQSPLPLDDKKQYFEQIYDWYVRGVLPARAALQRGENPYEFGVRNPETNISGLSFVQALRISDEWHASLVNKDQGVEYLGEKPSDIVFGPKWSDPKYNGWTIKSVYTKNNLKAEGSKVGHCVGGYYEDVQNKNCRIFSLRDPQNVPYVTMEVSQSGWEFKQIRGNGPKTGNAEPSDELKGMIGEWLRTLPGASLGDSEFDYRDLSYRDLEDDLNAAVYKDLEGYNVPVNISNWDYDEAYAAISKVLNGDRIPRSKMIRVGQSLGSICVNSDIEKIKAGYASFENIKMKAISMAASARKHPGYKNISFDKFIKRYRKPEDAIELLKPYIINTEGSSKITIKMLEEAYQRMSSAYRYPRMNYNNSKEFDNLSNSEKKEFFAKALDGFFSVTVAEEKREKNDEDFYSYYDDSHLDFPEEPERENFASDQEFKKALRDHEDEVNRIRDEDADYYRTENFPYCLDNAVMDRILDLLGDDSLPVPEWIFKFFEKEPNLFDKSEYEYSPKIISLLSWAKSRKKEKTSKWFGRAKYAEFTNFNKTPKCEKL